MDAMAMAERRQLRRKLGFWRLVALVFLVAIGFALYTTFVSDDRTGRPHVAQVRISGMITDDRELLDRLDKIADDDAVKALSSRSTLPAARLMAASASSRRSAMWLKTSRSSRMSARWQPPPAT